MAIFRNIFFKFFLEIATPYPTDFDIQKEKCINVKKKDMFCAAAGREL